MHTGAGCGIWNYVDLSFHLESLGLEALCNLTSAQLVVSVPHLCSLPSWASWFLNTLWLLSLLESLNCKFS